MSKKHNNNSTYQTLDNFYGSNNNGSVYSGVYGGGGTTTPSNWKPASNVSYAPKTTTIYRPKPKGPRYYCAYGSNTNISQMKYRVPNSKLVGVGMLDDFELLFKGHGTGGYCTIEQKQGSAVPVVVWELTPEEERTSMDSYEGYPSFYYKREGLKVTVHNPYTGKTERLMNCFAYIMRESYPYAVPSNSYIRGVSEGYQSFDLDKTYLDTALKVSFERLEEQFKKELTDALEEYHKKVTATKKEMAEVKKYIKKYVGVLADNKFIEKGSAYEEWAEHEKALAEKPKTAKEMADDYWADYYREYMCDDDDDWSYTPTTKTEETKTEETKEPELGIVKEEETGGVMKNYPHTLEKVKEFLGNTYTNILSKYGISENTPHGLAIGALIIRALMPAHCYWEDEELLDFQAELEDAVGELETDDAEGIDCFLADYSMWQILDEEAEIKKAEEEAAANV